MGRGEWRRQNNKKKKMRVEAVGDPAAKKNKKNKKNNDIGYRLQITITLRERGHDNDAINNESDDPAPILVHQ